MVRFRVKTKLTSFPLARPTSTVLSFSDADLAAAIFATGRAPGNEFRYGRSSLYEFIHRVALMPAYIRSVEREGLGRSSLAIDLDRSEKVNLSYLLGQAMAGLFAQEILGVDRLMHVDRYGRHHGIGFGPSRKRPDLFGQGTHGWVVLEAKGRSNAMESTLARTVKEQARSVANISRETPWVAAGTVAYFPPSDEVMTLYAIDPNPKRQGLTWTVDPDRFVEAYYEPFLRVLDTGQDDTLVNDVDDRVEAVDLGLIGVQVGLRRDLTSVLRERTAGNREGLADEVDRLLDATEDDEVARADGSWFKTLWGEAMNQEDYKG